MGKFIVTGAFGYSGKYIARRLIDQGHVVHTVTGSPDRENPFHGRVSASPFHFDRPEELVAALAGAQALINTYWVRFDHRDFTHSEAVNNTLALFRAAKGAGVKRVVHISITKPTLDSDLPYFKGKAELERALVESGLSYAILRPTILFGEEDILVNNIAWALRRFPVFGIFGDGSYRLQPIYVDDLASLAVEQTHVSEDTVIDAIGPETFTFHKNRHAPFRGDPRKAGGVVGLDKGVPVPCLVDGIAQPGPHAVRCRRMSAELWNLIDKKGAEPRAWSSTRARPAKTAGDFRRTAWRSHQPNGHAAWRTP